MEEKRASVTVRPKLTASTLVAVGLVPPQCSVTFPQSALQHTSTHTHTQMELPAGLIVSLDDPYESHCPYSSQTKTHTLIFPLFSLTIKINTCSQISSLQAAYKGMISPCSGYFLLTCQNPIFVCFPFHSFCETGSSYCQKQQYHETRKYDSHRVCGVLLYNFNDFSEEHYLLKGDSCGCQTVQKENTHRDTI